MGMFKTVPTLDGYFQTRPEAHITTSYYYRTNIIALLDYHFM